MLNVGFENYISLEYISAICGNPSAAPIKKHLQGMKTNYPTNVVDFTNGNALKSIVYMTDGSIALSSIASKTLKERYCNAKFEEKNPIRKEN